MFSKKEASQLRKEFWMIFGQYMSPVLSSEGEKNNWINYKTGVKGLQFKMNVVQDTASISIEINQPDVAEQKIIFEKLLQLKHILNNSQNEKWNWLLHTPDENGKLVSKVYLERKGVNIMRKEDWPALISFFKPRMMALDGFWNSVKYGFEEWQ